MPIIYDSEDYYGANIGHELTPEEYRNKLLGITETPAPAQQQATQDNWNPYPNPFMPMNYMTQPSIQSIGVNQFGRPLYDIGGLLGAPSQGGLLSTGTNQFGRPTYNLGGDNG